MDLTDVHSFIRLNDRKAALDAQLKAVKEELARLEQTLLEQFAHESLQRCRVDDQTVYLQRKIKATAASDREHLIATLKSIGLGHFVHEAVHPSTLSAYVADLDREGAPLPDELQEAVRVEELFSLRVRRT